MIGDYGEVDDIDWNANNMSWKYGFPVVSKYSERGNNQFIIFTEADRLATTILLPEEYKC